VQKAPAIQVTPSTVSRTNEGKAKKKFCDRDRPTGLFGWHSSEQLSIPMLSTVLNAGESVPQNVVLM